MGLEGGGGEGSLQRIWSYWRGVTHNNFELTVTVCRRIEFSVIKAECKYEKGKGGKGGRSWREEEER